MNPEKEKCRHCGRTIEPSLENLANQARWLEKIATSLRLKLAISQAGFCSPACLHKDVEKGKKEAVLDWCIKPRGTNGNGAGKT